MDNIDEVIKPNHKDHPTNKAYKVFFFYIEEQSEYFKSILEKEIFFLSMVKMRIEKGKYFYLELERLIIKSLRTKLYNLGI